MIPRWGPEAEIAARIERVLLRGFKRRVARSALTITGKRYSAMSVHLAVERLVGRHAIICVGHLPAGAMPWQVPARLFVLAETAGAE